ncbi:centrosomal protein of 55 kDa-like [Brachionichthys hirsutus]|uniref:centrosomal protein of 55 kDa-like n=1 Tax=Brachionichthys hirsutus TaxID=412623 RepID=UPI003604CBAC
MASSAYKLLLRRKVSSRVGGIVSGLKKENAYLKRSLAEMSRQNSEHNQLIEDFLSVEAIRLERCHQLAAKEEKIALLLMQLIHKEDQYQDLCVQALEKNKQLLDYDLKSEADERKRLQGAAAAAAAPRHTEDHAAVGIQNGATAFPSLTALNVNVKRYFSLCREGGGAREQLDTAQQNRGTQSRQEQWQNEAQAQRQPENMKKGAAEDEHLSEDEEERRRKETADLRSRLDEERCRSDRFELQAYLCEEVLFGRHLADQRTIRDLERQRDQEDRSSWEVSHPPSVPSAAVLVAPPHRSGPDGSFLECPVCWATYPVSCYKELLAHLDTCQC